jgi:hypothetical protein
MENQMVSPYKNAFRYGLYLGLISIIISVLLFLFGLQTVQGPQYLQFVLVIITVIFGTRHHRDAELGGYISYGRALGTGLLICFFSALISAVYWYPYVSFIDAEFLPRMLELQEEELIKAGVPDDQIEQTMPIYAMVFKPLPFTLLSIFMMTLMGFVISLITSAFLKKENPSFGENFK